MLNWQVKLAAQGFSLIRDTLRKYPDDKMWVYKACDLSDSLHNFPCEVSAWRCNWTSDFLKRTIEYTPEFEGLLWSLEYMNVFDKVFAHLGEGETYKDIEVDSILNLNQYEKDLTNKELLIVNSSNMSDFYCLSVLAIQGFSIIRRCLEYSRGEGNERGVLIASELSNALHNLPSMEYNWKYKWTIDALKAFALKHPVWDNGSIHIEFCDDFNNLAMMLEDCCGSICAPA